MASITLAIDEELKSRMDKFPWVNWSEVAREESNKKRIFEEYLRSRKLSKEDEKFCKRIDWHPVDELPLKKSFVKELKRIEKGPHTKITLDELDKLLRLK